MEVDCVLNESGIQVFGDIRLGEEKVIVRFIRYEPNDAGIAAEGQVVSADFEVVLHFEVDCVRMRSCSPANSPLNFVSVEIGVEEDRMIVISVVVTT